MIRIQRRPAPILTIHCLRLYLVWISFAALIALLIWSRVLDRPMSRYVVYYSSGTNETGVQSAPLLTLTTTCGSSADRLIVCKNAIMNWARLSTNVNLILFDTDPELRLLGETFGWLTVRPPSTLYGLPVLKELFIRAQQLYSTPYYGYANGDLLFTDDLLVTLRAISGYHFHGNKGLLIVGRRTNFNLTDLSSAHRYSFEEVRWRALNGSLFQYNAQDYFIVTKDSFFWPDLPNFVVGRVAYDNWLVTRAILDRVLVVDATDTILALHQTGRGGNFEGHKSRLLKGKEKESASVNEKLAGRWYSYDLGRTFCSDLLTTWSPDGRHVVLKTRRKWGIRCMIGFRKWNILPVDVRWTARSSTIDADHLERRVVYDKRMIENLIDQNKEFS